MSETRIKTVDITPDWAPLIPALLAAYANCHHRLETDDDTQGGCRRLDDEDRCEVHDAYFDDDADEYCWVGLDNKRHYKWRQERRDTMRNVESELTRLAQHVDRLNATARKEREG